MPLEPSTKDDPGLDELLVDGEADIDKTMLVRAWAIQVEASGGTVLWGRCDELGRMLPLQAILRGAGS